MQFLSCLGRSVATILISLLLVLPAQSETVSQALARGDAPAARRALENELVGNPKAALLRAQLEGVIAASAGDYEKAVMIFRAILKAAPSYEPARLQLYRALDKMGQRQEAAIQARRIAMTTDDERLKESLLADIARSPASRPTGIAMRFSLLPSTNITGGTRTRTVVIGGVPFELDAPSREVAGIGLSLGATAWHAFDVSRHWRGVLSASADLRVYDTSLRPNEAEMALRLDMSRRAGKGTFSFGPRISTIFQEGQEARRQAGFGLSGEIRLNDRTWLSFRAESLDQRFPGAEFRDGTKSTASAGIRWAAAPSLSLSIELSGARETAVAEHLAHRDLGIGIGFDTQLRGGMVFGADVFAGHNRYDADYPGFGTAREDDVTSLRVSVSHPRIGWRGVSPELSATRKRQSSNIPIHDTWTTEIGLSVGKRF